MKTKNVIDNLTNNIVFKRIEEEAGEFYKKNYKNSPLELLLCSNHDLLLESSLSNVSFLKSITIYHCFLKIEAALNSFKLLEFKNYETGKQIFKENSKYVDYLYYNKETIQIDALHKLFLSKKSSLNYFNLFNYFILNKINDSCSYKNLSEFIIFYIAKLDDLKISFCKKWDPILSTLNSICSTYFYKNFNDFDDYLDYKLILKNNLNKNSGNISIPTMALGSNTYKNMYHNLNNSSSNITNIKNNLNLKNNDKLSEEYIEFFISIIKSFIKYIYNLNSLKNKQYDFFKCLIENDFLFRSFKNYKRYFYNTKIGTLSTLSNFNAIKNGLNAHKENLKIIKNYVNKFNIESLNQLKNDGDILTYIILDNYSEDFKKFFNKYLEKVNKITIRT